MPNRLMIKDIKKIVAELKADTSANAAFYTDVRIKRASVAISAKDNLDYSLTMTLTEPVRGMYPVGVGSDIEYKEGYTSTVTIPLGTAISILTDFLLDVEGDAERAADDIIKLSKLLEEDAHKEALSPEGAKYSSYLSGMLSKSRINVIARNVKKGKVKSLFSINDVERDADYDSIWHDAYNLSGVADYKIIEAAAALRKLNEANGTAAGEGKTQVNALADALAKFAANNGASTIAQQ